MGVGWNQFLDPSQHPAFPSGFFAGDKRVQQAVIINRLLAFKNH